MFCNCGMAKEHMMHVRVGGVIFLLVGLVYVAESMKWISVNLPNFWALLLLLVGLMMVGCTGCYQGK